MENIYGIWIGKNATVAVAEDFRISFLRLKDDLIAAILYHNEYGTVGAVYGHGKNFDSRGVAASVNPQSKIPFNSSEEGAVNLENHSKDKIELDGETLIYITYNGIKFELTLAESIDTAMFSKKDKIDNTLSLAKKMALWETGKCFEYADGHFNVRLDTKRYSILYSFSLKDGWIYCRVGQNGYCEKGRAMLSTVCIRQNETRMLDDNLLSINEYKPIEDCFAKNGCAFPDDGGWYWSVKEVTDDVIYLNGCGGAIYEIRRK